MFNPSFAITVIISLILISTPGCSEDEQEAHVLPGNYGDISGLIIKDDGSITECTEMCEQNASDEDMFCSFAHPGQTVAIINGLTSRQNTVTVPLDCDEPSYSSTALINEVETLAVLHGEPLPRTFLATVILDKFGQSDLPFEGETKLVSLRKVDNDWFVTRSIDVSVINDESNQIDSTSDNADQLPISSISEECESISSNYMSECPDFHDAYFMNISEEDWEDIIFVPGESTCPTNNTQAPDNGISDECTDDNPC